MGGSFVSYLRVSTDRQRRSGLSLEAQRKEIAEYLAGSDSLVLQGEALAMRSLAHRRARPHDHETVSGSLL